MERGFVTRSLVHRGESHLYSVYVPNTLPQAPPVVLYLHGLGRGGRDGVRPTRGSLGAAIRDSPESFPFLVVFPQSPDDAEFVGDVADLCIEVLGAACEEFGADVDRTYLLGGSMGGHGAYWMAASDPARWAALVITCSSPRLPEWRQAQLGPSGRGSGGAVFEQIARGLGSLPVRIFHGALDETVSVDEARQVGKALRSSGGNVGYTEYPDSGHGDCGRPFRDPRLWAWLGTQVRTGEPPP